MSEDTRLSDAQIDALVERIAYRVKRELQLQAVTPNPEVRGTWQDQTGLDHLVQMGVSRVGTAGEVPPSGAQIAKYIDHTLLKPTATRDDIVQLCQEARQYGFASVCVNTTWVGLCARLLEGCPSKAIAVVGFPLGAMSAPAKSAETRQAIADGADEIDMVINIGKLKSGDHDGVYEDIRSVVQAAQGRPVKVILETSMLSREEKIAGCALSKSAGAHFVKTSTGFGGGGATAEDVALMRAIVGADVGVKASGGVRTAEDAQKMIAAGANRLGASAGIAIIQGKAGSSAY